MIKAFNRPWLIVGAGRLGGLIALMAEAANVRDIRTWSRSNQPSVLVGTSLTGSLDDVWASADGAVVWLTVVDTVLEGTARSLAGSGAVPALVLHGSGSLSSRALVGAGVVGPVGSLHPLLSIAQPAEALSRVSDVTWTYEGSEEGRALAEHLLSAFSNEPIVVDSDLKTLYHASAVAASGLVTATVDIALTIAEAAGFTPDQARKMLVPLAASTVDNLRGNTPREALTGPVARGDVSTIRDHLEELAGLDDPDLLEAYRILSRRLASDALRREAKLDD